MERLINDIEHLPYLKYDENILKIKNISCLDLIKDISTPIFLYLPERFEQNYSYLKSALNSHIPESEIAYAMKANYLGYIVKHAKSLDMNAEVMSLFEILIAKQAGFDFHQMVFNGPAKTEEELDLVISNNIKYLNAESMNELQSIEKIAEKQKKIQEIAVRIHPLLSKETEKKLLIKKNSKLGIDYERAIKLLNYAKNSPHLNPIGIHVHIGTNIVSHDLYDELLVFINNYIKEIKNKHNIYLDHINLGGGLASKSVLDHNAFDLNRYAKQIAENIEMIDELKIILEPGRYLVEDSFIAVSNVLRVKHTWGRKWAFLDIGANSLIPMRYSHYKAIPSQLKGKGPYCRIGGPLCLPVDVISNESVDFQIDEGDKIIILNCGAYTLSMSEQFGYPRPAVYELNKSGNISLIKKADNVEDMVKEVFDFDTEVQ